MKGFWSGNQIYTFPGSNYHALEEISIKGKNISIKLQEFHTKQLLIKRAES